MPESRSVARQWLPLEVQLDTTANQKEDPAVLGGLDEVEVFYFDPIIIGFLITGFLLLACCRRDSFVRSILTKFLGCLIWLYLTSILILIFSLSSRYGFWLQPGILMVLLGYLILSFGGIFDFITWMTVKLKTNPRGGT